MTPSEFRDKVEDIGMKIQIPGVGSDMWLHATSIRPPLQQRRVKLEPGNPKGAVITLPWDYECVCPSCGAECRETKDFGRFFRRHGLTCVHQAWAEKQRAKAAMAQATKEVVGMGE